MVSNFVILNIDILWNKDAQSLESGELPFLSKSCRNKMLDDTISAPVVMFVVIETLKNEAFGNQTTVRAIHIGTLTQLSSFWLCTPPQWT